MVYRSLLVTISRVLHKGNSYKVIKPPPPRYQKALVSRSVPSSSFTAPINDDKWKWLGIIHPNHWSQTSVCPSVRRSARSVSGHEQNWLRIGQPKDWSQSQCSSFLYIYRGFQTNPDSASNNGFWQSTVINASWHAQIPSLIPPIFHPSILPSAPPMLPVFVRIFPFRHVLVTLSSSISHHPLHRKTGKLGTEKCR